MSLLAPAGTPITIPVLGKSLIKIQADHEILDNFHRALAAKFGVQHCIFMSSGRAALSVLLSALYEMESDHSQTEVIVPAYTCYSVPGSVEKAGLSIRVCDIDPQTLSYDTEKLANFDFSKVLAIVTANLYGIPNNLPAIEEIAKSNNVHLVDDAAQCMGGKIAGRYSGTFGTAGLYSLDKGKNITSIQGGIMVTNSDVLAAILRKKILALPEQSPVSVLTDIIKLVIYSALLPPKIYGITKLMPFLNLGQTIYTTDYPMTQYSPRLGAVALELFHQLDALTHRRKTNATALTEALKNVAGIKFIQQEKTSESVDIRLPILVEDSSKREELCKRLLDNGISASYSYPLAVADIPELETKIKQTDLDTPGGRTVASQIMTLPTHPYVKTSHIDKMVNIIKTTMEL